MPLIRTTLAAFLITTASFAHDAGLYGVIDVAADDTLNMRAGAGASHAVLDGFRNGALVSVTGFDAAQKWASVQKDGQVGWVSMRFLTLIDIASKTTIPAETKPLICSGTEPFWSAAIGSEQVFYSDIEANAVAGGVTFNVAAAGRPPRLVGFSADPLSGALRQQSCSDGMSDITYDWSVMLINRSGTGSRVVEGCCRLQAQ